jgi:mortality factor 4-like protein 1
VEERDLYEVTKINTRFAERISEEAKALRERFKGKNNTVKMATEFERIMVVLEKEKRIEEQKEQHEIGIKVEDQKGDAERVERPSKPTRQTKWTKARVDNELKLRAQHLLGRRNQAHADLLILPLSFKKILVEEWEIISQCRMLPFLPAKVTVSDAMQQYLVSKLEILEKTTKEDQEMVDAQQEWSEMVEGILLFFDQGIPSRLLYPQETAQYNKHVENGKRHCEVYGCEHLLRMFVRLPCILAEHVGKSKARTMLSKVNDLVRYLLKHEGTFFLQFYQKAVEDELPPKKRKGGT